MIDHITLRVSNIAKSTVFYEAALGALGYTNTGTYDGAVQFTAPGKQGDVWIYQDTSVTTHMHIAVSAADSRQVDAFHAAGIEAGGADNGKPGVRTEYAANYYAAFLLDPDGNNIEAVFFTS